MLKQSPTLIIFAGANGSGKTTFAKRFLPYAKIREFVNADEIARGLSPFNPEGQKLKAGKLVLSRVHELINKGDSFAIESTLAGKTLAPLLKRAHQKNYSIKMYYIYTKDAGVNIRRIKYRVKQGGHNVPSEDVRRRYKRSLNNLFRLYFDLCDTISVYNNSAGKPKAIAFKTSSGVLVSKADRAVWERMVKQGKRK